MTRNQGEKILTQHKLDKKLITVLITSLEKEHTPQMPAVLTHKATESWS